MSDWKRLPCGCQIGTDIVGGRPTLLFEPCAMDCPYYLYVLQESAAQAKPVHTIDLR